MSELGKPFFEKSNQKIQKPKYQSQNTACEQKKTTSEKYKFGSDKKLGLE